MWLQVKHPTAGVALQSGAPFAFSDPELQQRDVGNDDGTASTHFGVDYSRPAPELGEHTDEILRHYLGYSEEATAALRAGDVIR